MELILWFTDLEKYGFILPDFNPLLIVLLNSYTWASIHLISAFTSMWFSITREQGLSHTSFFLTDECKWEKGHGQLQYHFTNHSHVIPGESILNNTNVCYKLSKLTCINVESHYINAVFVTYLLYLLWYLSTIHLHSQQILIYIKYLLWAKHCSIYPLNR